MLKFSENYEKNKNLYKPLKLTHGYTMDYFDFGSDGAVDFDEQCRIIERGIDELINIGYGGIVTNISFDNYFQDENAKKLLKHKVEYCRQKELRVWLYDERGYPSGKAGGLTLKKNPDFEAKGIVGIFETVNPGETVSLKFPHGHEKVIAAYAYCGTCFDDIDINSAVLLMREDGGASDLHYTNHSENTQFIAYIISKRLYEGTHAERNYDDARRYPDLMNKDAVAEFISNTYEAYREIVGEYFGNTIEAIFTDEPSCIAYYLGNLPTQIIHDKIDETIPLLPVINWTNDFKARFKNLYGYEIDKYLPYVFGGNTTKACDIRGDYHNAVSKFYEESFFAQIGDFCAKNNIAFSGHLLMEETLSIHPPFEGNFFHQLKHMQYPGIDMLTSIPESVFGAAQVPKLIASVAALNGREHVMSEASGYAETIINKQKLTYEQMIGACVLQYALGVDTFTSYYQRDAINEKDYRIWNDTLGRIAALMNGGTQKSRILLYYPIETANRYYMPQYHFNESSDEYFKKQDFSFAQKSGISANSWSDLSRSLLKNQLDYFMVDSETLQNAKFCEKAININANKNDFEILVLPVCDITENLLEVIKNLTEKNITVLAVANPEFADQIEKAGKFQNFKSYKDENDLINGLKGLITPDVLFRKEASIIYMKKENQNGLNYLFVNSTNSEIKTVVELYLGSHDKKDRTFSIYNPSTNEKVPVNVEIVGSKAIFNLHLPEYGFTVLMVR